MTDAEVVERLDLMLAVLQLAHHDAIVAAGEHLRSEPINAAILDSCPTDDWIPAGDLIASVRAHVEASERSVQRHLASLVGRRAIQRRGATHTTAYRSLGLV